MARQLHNSLASAPVRLQGQDVRPSAGLEVESVHVDTGSVRHGGGSMSLFELFGEGNAFEIIMRFLAAADVAMTQ